MCVLFNSVSSLCVVVCVCGAGTGAIPVQTLRWGVRRRLARLLRTHGNAGGKEREAEGGRRGGGGEKCERVGGRLVTTQCAMRFVTV